MNWTETETVVTICTGIATCTQLFLWSHISKTKAYIEEKAKLLAREEKIEVLTTIAERAKSMVIKEDIEDITRKIESVKESYNKALESHKIQLQKEFESSMYIIELCKRLDSELIDLIKEHIDSTSRYYNDDYYDYATNKSAIDSLSKLSIFLSNFKQRYENNIDAKTIICCYNDYLDITKKPENEEEEEKANKDQDVHLIEVCNIFEKSRISASNLLSFFLPKLSDKK